MSRAAFATAHDISSYSFAALAKGARPLMQGRNASLLTLTYLGAMRALANYNVMGLAKASLEANVRYLAACLGPEGIRVNGISAGPIKTLAAAGIGGFSKILRFVEKNAPLRRNVTIDEVGNVAAFLLSDLASAITGEITYVDCGFSTVAAGHGRVASCAARRARASRAHGRERAPQPLRRRHHRRRPQRPHLRRLSRRRRAVGVRRSSGAASLGGAAVTEEFHPGFRNSTASYTVSLLDPKVIRDLNLAEHGLAIVERPFANFLPLPDGGYLKVGGGLAATQAEVAKFSRARRAALPAYYAMLDRVADVLRELLLATPPNVGGGMRARCSTRGRSAKRFRALDLRGQRDVLDLFTKSAGDLLDRWFESAPIKAAFGFDAVVGNFASPYTPGSAYVLLHHVFGEVNGKRGQWGHARGGMGAITQAMAKECAARGVEMRTDARRWRA